MGTHNISLNPAYSRKEKESLIDMIDALAAARDIANMLSIAATALPKHHAEAFCTTAILLEEALCDISGRIQNIRDAEAA